MRTFGIRHSIWVPRRVGATELRLSHVLPLFYECSSLIHAAVYIYPAEACSTKKTEDWNVKTELGLMKNVSCVKNGEGQRPTSPVAGASAPNLKTEPE